MPRSELFVARRDGKDVGRIAAILDRGHNEFHDEKTAFFGFFESENDAATAAALFDAAGAWGKARGMTILRGPANPSLNDEAGLLVDGFGSPPVLMMTYNPRYYVPLYENAGFQKAKDLLAYWFPLEEKPLARLLRVADRLRKRESDIVIRTVGKGQLAKELPKIREVYNDAWEKNWGFVPMSSEEMDFMAKRLKPLVVEELLWLAEAKKPDGTLEPVAFMLMLPDYNVAMAKAGGSLLPFGWLKFLLALKKIKTVRVMTLGLKKPYRKRGHPVDHDGGLAAVPAQEGLHRGRSLVAPRRQRARDRLGASLGRRALQDLPDVRPLTLSGRAPSLPGASPQRRRPRSSSPPDREGGAKGGLTLPRAAGAR